MLQDLCEDLIAAKEAAAFARDDVLSIENEILTAQAGAGIVADSDPENERKETLNKAMAIQKALELIKT